MEYAKVDPHLVARHRAYLLAMEAETPAGSPADEYLAVAVVFEGPVARLEEAGLLARSVYGPVAYGNIRVADLERLVALREVNRVEAESQARPLLDKSAPEINAPAVWSGSPSYKGTGVVVGIVDTGIDIFHNCFRKPDDGNTRILFLWDQTLPASGGTPPAGFTYGQEFTAAQINAALGNPNQPFAQQDVDGHGTHVAGAAVGDGTQAGNCHGGDHYIGVAPDADLIIVKSEFGGLTYVDGAKYIFDKADSLSPARPAVVNLSLGGVGAPHDGTSADELALDALLTPAPPGKVIVAAAGNSADDGYHAYKNVAANGSETMTFRVLAGDRFRSSGAIWYGGTGRPATGPGVNARLKLTLRAPDGTTVDIMPGNNPPAQAFGGGTVDLYSQLNVGRVGRHQISFDLAPPSQGLLAAGEWRITLEETAGAQTDADCWLSPSHYFKTTDPVAANGSVTIGFNVGEKVQGTSSGTITYTGAARLSITLTTPDPDTTQPVAAGAGAVSKSAGDHTVRVVSELNTPGAGQHKIQFWIDVKVGETVDTGLWTVTLTETAGHATTAEGSFPEERPWTQVTDPGGGTHTELNEPRFVDADQEPSRTVESPATAQNVIAVGAYDPRDGTLAAFSSRGPTVEGRDKPDLCAPGVAITAPKTRARGVPLVSDCCMDFYVDKQGTSMAAPHVTGVVALMLQRNKTLDFTIIRATLKRFIRPVPSGNVNEWGAGKLEAQLAVANIPAEASGGGGGSGGGGPSAPLMFAPMNHGVLVPIAASWPRYLPTPHRIGELQRALSTTPAGHLFMALMSRHLDEIIQIVNGVRKVAVIWHRMQGPLLIWTVLGWEGDTRPLVPRVVGGRSVAEGLERLLRVLERYASPLLLHDLNRYRTFVLSLPGSNCSDLYLDGEQNNVRAARHP